MSTNNVGEGVNPAQGHDASSRGEGKEKEKKNLWYKKRGLQLLPCGGEKKCGRVLCLGREE